MLSSQALGSHCPSPSTQAFAASHDDIPFSALELQKPLAQSESCEHAWQGPRLPDPVVPVEPVVPLPPHWQTPPLQLMEPSGSQSVS